MRTRRGGGEQVCSQGGGARPDQWRVGIEEACNCCSIEDTLFRLQVRERSDPDAPMFRRCWRCETLKHNVPVTQWGPHECNKMQINTKKGKLLLFYIPPFPGLHTGPLPLGAEGFGRARSRSAMTGWPWWGTTRTRNRHRGRRGMWWLSGRGGGWGK